MVEIFETLAEKPERKGSQMHSKWIANGCQNDVKSKAEVNIYSSAIRSMRSHPSSNRFEVSVKPNL